MPAFLKSKIFIALVVVLALAAGLAIGAAYWAMKQIEAPGPLAEARLHVVEKGAGVNQIARELEEAGVISDGRLFRLYVRYRRLDSGLHAGEYQFGPAISMADVLAQLVAGKTVQHLITVPEGLTSYEAAAIVAAAEGLVGGVEPPPEGSILPETYSYSYGETRAAVIRRMQDAMRQTLAELWQSRAPDLPVKTPEEAVTLASIVERETGVPDERPRVAAVFANRLRKGMRLQADPTVIYGITRGKTSLGRVPEPKDLEIDDPYNTYRVAGLPPGPICNPGRAALAAVLNPIKTTELYFVANGTGGHAFASTLEEHNRNINRWRRFLREQRNKANQN